MLHGAAHKEKYYIQRCGLMGDLLKIFSKYHYLWYVDDLEVIVKVSKLFQTALYNVQLVQTKKNYLLTYKIQYLYYSQKGTKNTSIKQLGYSICVRNHIGSKTGVNQHVQKYRMQSHNSYCKLWKNMGKNCRLYPKITISVYTREIRPLITYEVVEWVINTAYSSAIGQLTGIGSIIEPQATSSYKSAKVCR